MTTAELAAIARSIIPPAGASVAIALVDHKPGTRLANGSPSGTGGRTTFRAGFLVNGRLGVPTGPTFERQRDALRLVHLLNGSDPAPRPGQTTVPNVPVDVSEDSRDASAGPTGAPTRTCAGCGRPLPIGARPNRRTHGEACRKAASRPSAARPAPNGPDAAYVGGAPDVTVSRRHGPSRGRAPRRAGVAVASASSAGGSQPAVGPRHGQRGEQPDLGLSG